MNRKYQITKRIYFLFETADLWIGAFWDGTKRRLYIFPVPMLGVVIQFSSQK